ncbi:malate dehydrogenase, mitochondrial-like [Prorops nasuta]|uniref:malate dehydrogenase, mitochondrial-like n=1 Tax=Prorops nasuta TaxID=863751 RepID=UPI0034CD6480
MPQNVTIKGIYTNALRLVILHVIFLKLSQLLMKRIVDNENILSVELQKMHMVNVSRRFIRKTCGGLITLLCENSQPEKMLLERKMQMGFFNQSSRCYSRCLKVAILGCSSMTGKCLSLFLKQSPLIDELALYDADCMRGMVSELNQIDSKCKVSGHDSSDLGMKNTLLDAKIVLILDKDDQGGETDVNCLFEKKAETLSQYMYHIVNCCPRAMIAIAMQPRNSLVPFAVETLRKFHTNEIERIFGVITEYCVRANTVAARIMKLQPEYVVVPVIGGGSSTTCIPLYSQCSPCKQFRREEIRYMTQFVRSADDEINRKNYPFVMSSFAIARFCTSLCKALRHERGIMECTYVSSHVMPEIKYFSSMVELGPDGIQKYMEIPQLSDIECELVLQTIPILQKDIKKGEMRVAEFSASIQ